MEDKINKKNETIFLIAMFSIPIGFIMWVVWFLGIVFPRVSQDLYESKIDGRFKYLTTVYYQGEIVWSSFDDVETVNDSILSNRLNKANSIANLIKKY